jgi:phosphoglycerol transferase
MGLYSFLDFFNVPEYVKGQIQQTKLYDNYYVDPETAEITFPENKRNLIYIFMESMENTYMSTEEGGVEYANFIPEMTELELANTNFTASGNINGAIATSKTTWTFAAMMAETCGIPCILPVDANTVGNYDDVFTGVYSLGQILEEQGYQQELLIGSDGNFAGRDSFFQNHGNYEVKDYYYAVDNEWIPDDYYVWWGYEDEKLYTFAKEELLELASCDEPFNLTMLTVDTHFFSGYVCDICEETFGEDQYANVISCASRQVTDFISWIQEQDFYENTTIVICGDHPTMDDGYISKSTDGLSNNYLRTVYTTVINPAVSYDLDYDRTFTTMDMYPTTLASLGATIEGDRLGLGTNLYSDTPTLVEMMGIDALNQEIQKKSWYYETKILYGE